MATEKELKDRLAKEKAKVNDEKKSDTIRKKAKKQIEKIEKALAELGGDVVKGAKEVVTKGKDLAKMTDKEFEKAKTDLADKLGNTEEECEEIIKKFKDQRAKAKRSKAKRTNNLQKSGNTTTPKSSEINAKKVLSNASDTIGDKLQKQVDGLESEAKRNAKDKVKDQNLTTAQKNKKVEELVKNEVRKQSKVIADKVALETKSIISEISSKLSSIDKQLRLTYLRKVKAEVEALISKMMFGGLTDGAVANMNVTQSQMSAESVNPQMYAKGGKTKELEHFLRNADKITTKDGKVVSKSEFLKKQRENEDFEKGLDDLYPNLSDDYKKGKFAKGGKTWIDSGKQNVQTRGSKGTFRAKADKQGISSGQLADKILANPSKYSKGERKSAQFVENIGVKEDGGEIMTADSVMEFQNGGVVYIYNDNEYDKDEIVDVLKDDLLVMPDGIQDDEDLINYFLVNEYMEVKDYAEGGKVRTNSKVVREAVRQHILDSVDDDGEEFDNVDEATNYMNERFKSEFDYENNKRRIPNDQERFSDYLNGLPFNFKFYNDDIEDFLNSLGINPEGKKYSNEQMNKLYHYLIWKEVSPKYYGYADGGEIMTADTQFEYEEGGSVRKPRLKKGDNIDIKANKWQDVYGNTYHIVRVYVNDDYLGESGYTYGYGNQFEETAKAMIFDKYAPPYNYKEGSMRNPIYMLKDKGINVDSYGTYVSRKKDMRRFAKGGKMEQGYNDRMDESLGMRNRGRHSQDDKDRRDEAKGMNEAMGNRAYQSVGTMDRMEEGGQLFDDLKIKKGAFTKKAKQRGLSTEAFMRKVLANPSRYDERTRKQAQLMKNMM